MGTAEEAFEEEDTPSCRPLKSCGDSVNDTLSQRYFGIGSITRRLMSVSTRIGTSRSDGTFRSSPDSDALSPHTEDELNGLLCREYDEDGEDDAFPYGPPHSRTVEGDEAGVAAIIKLRPALSDSVGDDRDDAELSARPLIGTERAGMLTR